MAPQQEPSESVETASEDGSENSGWSGASSCTSEAEGTTASQTCAALVTTIIGAGVLGFPATFSKGGWILSPILLILCAWAVAEIGQTLEDITRMAEGRLSASTGELLNFERTPRRYEDLCEIAFGPVGRPLAAFVVNTLMLFMGGAFMILIGQSLEFATGIAYHEGVFGAAVIFAFLSLLDDMTALAKLSSIGVAASIVYVLCIGCGGLRAAGHGPEPRTYILMPEASHMSVVGIVVSVMFLGFLYQPVVPTMRAEMQRPQELPRSIRGAVALATLIYMGAGALGYYGWGDKVQGNILQSMRKPDGSPMLEGLILSIAVIANLSVTFPIVLSCVYRSAETALGRGYSPSLRLLLLAVALAVALLVPFFLEFIALLSSVLGVFFVFGPLAIYWVLVTKGESGKYAACKLSSQTSGPINPGRTACGIVVRHTIVAALGFVSLVFGTWTSLIDLKAAFEARAAG